MINNIHPFKFIAALCCIFIFSFNKNHAQTDTLRLYFQGLQTKILDSNDVKIDKWAQKIKGKKAYVEIYTYYDNSDFKPYMKERAEEVNLVVIRKARDFVNISFSGAVKGKKDKRNVAEIIYNVQQSSSAESSDSSGNTNTTAPADSTKKEN